MELESYSTVKRPRRPRFSLHPMLFGARHMRQMLKKNPDGGVLTVWHGPTQKSHVEPKRVESKNTRNNYELKCQL